MNHLRFWFALSSVAILGGVAVATPGDTGVRTANQSGVHKAAVELANKQTLGAFVCVQIVTGRTFATRYASDPATPYSDSDRHPNFFLEGDRRAAFASAATPDDFIANSQASQLDPYLLQSLLNELFISDQMRNENLVTQVAMGNELNASPEAVPEPSTIAVFGAAALGFFVRRRRSMATN